MEQFAEIEGPVRIGFLAPLLMAAGAILLLGLSAWLLKRQWRRLRDRPPAEVMNAPSPLQQALSRLGELKGRMTAIAAEPFTVEVSDIVRDFLEASLEIPAREQTSEEFLAALQADAKSPEVLREQMPGFLTQCDQVKFARQQLAREQMGRLVDTAESVVRTVDQQMAAEPVPGAPESATSPAA